MDLDLYRRADAKLGLQPLPPEALPPPPAAQPQAVAVDPADPVAVSNQALGKFGLSLDSEGAAQIPGARPPAAPQATAQELPPPTSYDLDRQAILSSSVDASNPEGLMGAAGDLDAITGAQANAALRIGDATADSAKREVELYGARNEELKANEKEHRQAFADYDTEFKALSSEFRKLNEDVAKLPAPKDSRTKGQKVWGAIALMGATAADGVSAKDTHYAADVERMINTAVERDIQAQRDAIAKGRGDAAAKQTEMGLARQHFGDTDQALRFAYGLGKERFANQIEAEAAKLKNATARDQALIVAGNLKATAKKEQLDVLRATMANKNSMLNYAQMLAMSGHRDQAESFLRNAGFYQGQGEPIASKGNPIAGKPSKTQAGAETVVEAHSDIPDWTPMVNEQGVGPNDQDRKNAQEVLANRTALRETLTIAEEKLAAALDANRPVQERIEAAQDYSAIYEAWAPGMQSQSAGLGAPSGSEKESVQSALPKPPWIEDGSVTAWAAKTYQDAQQKVTQKTIDPRRVRFARDLFDRITNTKMRAYKYQPPSATGPAPGQTSSATRNAPASAPAAAPAKPSTPPAPKRLKVKGFVPG